MLLFLTIIHLLFQLHIVPPYKGHFLYVILNGESIDLIGMIYRTIIFQIVAPSSSTIHYLSWFPYGVPLFFVLSPLHVLLELLYLSLSLSLFPTSYGFQHLSSTPSSSSSLNTAQYTYCDSILVSFTPLTFVPFSVECTSLLNYVLLELCTLNQNFIVLHRYQDFAQGVMASYHCSDSPIFYTSIRHHPCFGASSLTPCLLCLVEMNPLFPLSLTTHLTSLPLMFFILKLLHHLLPLSMLASLFAVVPIGKLMQIREI